MHEKSRGEGICANAPLCTAPIRSVARACFFFFFVQARGHGTVPIVKEKGLINLSCLNIYQLFQSTHFEMYLGSLPTSKAMAF